MKKELVLLNKEYSDESLCDMGRDVHEIYQFPEDPDYLKTQQDYHGFRKGSYKVIIAYVLAEDEKLNY